MREKTNYKVIIGIVLGILLVGSVIAFLTIPNVKETILESKFIQSVSAYNIISPENLGTLTPIVSSGSWQNIKATGEEAGLKFWTANKDEKKTELGWIPESGSCIGWIDRNLYDENNNPILDDKNKQITLKCESSKCDSQNCYHISLTEAQAINIDSYVKLGESSSVVVYQNASRLEYDLDWGKLNITILKNISGEFITQVNDIWISYNEDSYKFGANDSSNLGIEQYKYIVESLIPIYNEGSRYYVRNPTPILDDGLMQYNSYEAHNIDFTDICSRNFGNETDPIESNCSFISYEDSGKYYLETTFLSDKDIDPQVILGESDVFTNAILNNVTLETNFTHLDINATGLEGYYSWDGQSDMGTAFDLSGNGRDCPATTTSPTEGDGVYGKGVNFTGYDYSCGREDWNIIGQSGFAMSFWINRHDEVQNWIFGNIYGRPVYIQLYNGDQIRSLIRATTATGYTTGSSFNADEWVHVVLTYTDGSGSAIYYNGVLDTTGTPSGTITNSLNENHLGGSGSASNPLSNTELDDFMIFSRGLSPTEITSIYNSQFPKFEQRGEQTIDSIDVSDIGGESLLNVTFSDCETNLTEHFNISIGASGGSYTYGIEYPVTDCKASDIPITTPTNISVKIIFNSPTGVLSPYLMGDITLDSWTGAGGDTDYPQITNIEDNNNTLTGSGIVIINSTITSTNGTAWVTFDGTDYQMDNVSTYFNTSFNIGSSGVYDYNISAYGNGTSTLLNYTQTYEYTINAIEDFDYPIFSNPLEKPTDGIEFNPDAVYEFNITIASTNGTANINFDSVNYSLSNVSSMFNWTRAGLSVGVYPYNYSAYGNGTLIRYNMSEAYSYTIVQNDSYVLGSSGTSPITYGTITDVAGTGCPGQLSCSLNMSNAIYEVGTHIFNYSTNGNTNYTGSSNTTTVVINQAIPEGTLNNNKAWAFVYDTLTATISISETNDGDGDLTYEIIVDNSSEGISYSQAGVGNYEVILNTTGGTNYTANSSMYSNRLIISQYTTDLSLGGTASISYGTAADITGSGCPAQISCELFRNDTVGAITNPDVNATLPVGMYLYTYNTTGNTNYSSDSETFELTVTSASQTATLTFNETSPKVYPTNLEADCNGELWRNDVYVNATENGIGILLGTQTHYYSCQLNATGELAYNEDNQTFIITIGTGVIDLKINGTDTNYTIEQSTSLDLNSTLTTGEGEIEILINNVQVVSGSSPIGITYNFTSAGMKNISAHYTATQNYSIAWDTLWVNVTSSGVPVLNITSPFGSINTTNNGLEINYTIDATGETCWWTNNSEDKNYLTPCGTNVTGQTWSDGLYNVTIYANNSVNNIAQESRIFRIDTTNPYFTNLQNRSSLIDEAFIYNTLPLDGGVGVDCVTTNDTTNFKMSCAGVLENNTAFDTEILYEINITVNDSLGHSYSELISIYISSAGTYARGYKMDSFGGNYPKELVFPLFGGEISFEQGDSGVIFSNPDDIFNFDGSVGIETTSPEAALDIVGDELRLSQSKTDNSQKIFKVTGEHYDSDDSPVGLLTLNSYATGNILYVGGGAGIAGINAVTSMRFYTAPTFSVASGTERMRIDGDGNVGIGTTSPSQTFHIKDSTAGTKHYLMKLHAGGSTGESGAILFSNTDSDTEVYSANIGSERNSDGKGEIYFGTNSGNVLSNTITERMRIDNDGNVGIGTTNPTSQLHIVGSDGAVTVAGTDGIYSIGGDGGDYFSSTAGGKGGDNSLIAGDGGTGIDVAAAPAGGLGGNVNLVYGLGGVGGIGGGSRQPAGNLIIGSATSYAGGVKIYNSTGDLNTGYSGSCASGTDLEVVDGIIVGCA